MNSDSSVRFSSSAGRASTIGRCIHRPAQISCLLPVVPGDLLQGFGVVHACVFCVFVAGTLSRPLRLVQKLLCINSACAWVQFLVSDNGLLDENQHTRLPLRAVNAVGVFPLESGICSPAQIESSRNPLLQYH